MVVHSRKKYLHDYYLRNQDRMRNNRDEYYRSHSKESNARSNKWSKNNPIMHWTHSVLSNHRRRGYLVSITNNQFTELAKKTPNCSICLRQLSWSSEGKNGRPQLNSPSLDRINNEKELRLDNVQVICWLCNLTKSSRTMQEFIDYCKMVANRFS